MKIIPYNEVVTEELLKGNLDHNEYEGFIQDYRTLHCLLRKYQPKSIFEIGTNIGSGINVIATALSDAKIYSLDLDYETMRQNSKQYPLEKNGGDRVGSAARFPYTQLRGDSMTFDYNKYTAEAYFIDGEHDYKHARHETIEVLKLKPNLIIWHDADMQEVHNAIIDSFQWNNNYQLYRVENTRIAYAVLK